jgi:glycerate-2-kinase
MLMSTAAIATAIKMLESLSEPAQEEVIEHLREYIAELQDEREWDMRFKRTQPELIATARRVKKQIAEGAAEPLDLDQL